MQACLVRWHVLRASLWSLKQSSGVLCCAVLCCAVLCCAVLCCAVLRCAVLCTALHSQVECFILQSDPLQFKTRASHFLILPGL